MNTVLWVITGLVAASFAASGVHTLVTPHEKYAASYGWARQAPRWAPRAIGVLELLGALGLVLPALVGVAEVLVPVAATALALLMVGAMVVHLGRGERSALVTNAVLLLLAAVVAIGRFGPSPL